LLQPFVVSNGHLSLKISPLGLRDIVIYMPDRLAKVSYKHMWSFIITVHLAYTVIEILTNYGALKILASRPSHWRHWSRDHWTWFPI